MKEFKCITGHMAYNLAYLSDDKDPKLTSFHYFAWWDLWFEEHEIFKKACIRAYQLTILMALTLTHRE